MEVAPGQINSKAAHPNEDEYICETCSTPRNMSTFSRSAMSVEGILLKVLAEIAEVCHCFVFFKWSLMLRQ